MNNNLMFSSKTGMWETPQNFFDELHNQYNFTLDVCATKENAKCERYFTPEMDGLSQSWEGMCWMNPPYGREIGKWVEKAYYERMKYGVTVVALLPARTDTKWFHDFVYEKFDVKVKFIKGRLKFGGCKNAAPFPSMLVIFD